MKRRMDQWHVTPSISISKRRLSPHTELSPPSLLSRKQPNEEVALRCETVLNTTMAEIETYHTQKVEDFASLAKEHLDGEIEFYEQVSDIKNSKHRLTSYITHTTPLGYHFCLFLNEK